MALLHLFMNNPTAGGVDGTEISGGDESLPLTFTLDASKAESGAAKCAVRCDSGYSIEGGAKIYAEGASSDTWSFAADNSFTGATDALTNASWQPQLVLSNVASSNVIFWAKATTTTQNTPANDRTVDIIAEGLVVVAE